MAEEFSSVFPNLSADHKKSPTALTEFKNEINV